MKSSLIILVFFVLGCFSGLYYTADFDIHEASVGVLYLLMLLLGINLGCNQDIKGFAKMINFKMLLVPIATVSGTFLFSAIAGFILSQWSVFDCMAVGSGFAYYSISSVLITQLKTPSIGMFVAARQSVDQTYRKGLYKAAMEIIMDWGVEIHKGGIAFAVHVKKHIPAGIIRTGTEHQMF